jgi:hypothetical protein
MQSDDSSADAPILAELVSWSSLDEVGTLVAVNGDSYRVGRSAFRELFPAVGLRAFITSATRHPQFGLRALTLASSSESESARRTRLLREEEVRARAKHLADEERERQKKADQQRRQRSMITGGGTVWDRWFDDFEFEKDIDQPNGNQIKIAWDSLFLEPSKVELASSGQDDDAISSWWLPEPSPIPSSYHELLSANNGGWAIRGSREFQFLGLKSVREYMWAYAFPWWYRRFIPFGLDGSGSFYAFLLFGEFYMNPPVYLINHGANEIALLAETLEGACGGDLNASDACDGRWILADEFDVTSIKVSK